MFRWSPAQSRSRATASIRPSQPSGGSCDRHSSASLCQSSTGLLGAGNNLVPATSPLVSTASMIKFAV